MFGNLLSGDMVIEYVEKGVISIDPFNADALSTAHYPLFPEHILFLTEHGKKVHDFSEQGEMEININFYGRVKISTAIRLKKGIVGVFTPASILIEKGLMLTAGKLDSGYKGPIIFGIYNASGRKVLFPSDYPVAHVSFYDLRAIALRETAKKYLEVVSKFRSKNIIEEKEMAKEFKKLGLDFNEYMGGS